MAIYLGAKPGLLFLASELTGITFSVQTGILLKSTLEVMLTSDSSQCQVAQLSVLRVGDQFSISDPSRALLISLEGAHNIVTHLPHYIAMASALSCAYRAARPANRPPMSRRLRNGQAIRRPN